MKVDRDLKRIWITWENQRRNRSLSSRMGFSLYELISEQNRLIRYFVLSRTTIDIIRVNKPNVVVCQNPSIVLTLLCSVLKIFFGYKLIVDCHNSGLYPKEGSYRYLNSIFNTINSFADVVLVSNDRLKREFSGVFRNIIVVPDPLPSRDDFYDSSDVIASNKMLWCNDKRFKFLYVCSWAADEPYEEVISAFSETNNNQLSCYITGNFEKAGVVIPRTENIVLTGFISDSDYHDLIESCDAMIVLTKRNDCLTCGAYEALSFCKPGVLSDTEVLRKTFGDAFLYSKAEKEDILDKVLLLAHSVDFFYAKVIESKDTFESYLEDRISEFKQATSD